MLLEMKSLDIDPCLDAGAAQGIVAILLPFPELAAVWHWGSSEVAGLGFSWSWAVPWLGSSLGSVGGSSRSLWVGPFAKCATAPCQQLIDDQVSQNLGLEV